MERVFEVREQLNAWPELQSDYSSKYDTSAAGMSATCSINAALLYHRVYWAIQCPMAQGTVEAEMRFSFKNEIKNRFAFIGGTNVDASKRPNGYAGFDVLPVGGLGECNTFAFVFPSSTLSPGGALSTSTQSMRWYGQYDSISLNVLKSATFGGLSNLGVGMAVISAEKPW